MPALLATVGASSAILGLIEGVVDGVSSFPKLLSGLYSDRLRRRKPLAVVGYFMTAGAGRLEQDRAVSHGRVALPAGNQGRLRRKRSTSSSSAVSRSRNCTSSERSRAISSTWFTRRSYSAAASRTASSSSSGCHGLRR